MKEPDNTTSETLSIKAPPSSEGGEPIKLSIKARRDDHDMNPSGWSIIAFTPSASIRCVRGHQIRHLNLFIRSIMALCGHSVSEEYFHSRACLVTPAEKPQFDEILRAIHITTQGEFLRG